MKEKKDNSFWNQILNNEKMLTDEEAEEIEKGVIQIRKESNWRKNIPNLYK